MRPALLLVLLAGAPATAFTIGTAFTEPCHERLTTRAFLETLNTWPVEALPAPTTSLAARLSDEYAATFAPELDGTYRFALMSLLVGVRAPDCNGHSLFDLSNLRVVHDTPDDQYAHALRAVADDGPEGEALVMAGVHAVLYSLAAQARSSRELITVQYEVDGRGLMELEVWAPAYFLGRATHAIQDSFSHTLRDDGLRTVRHVMNYTDALTTTHDEARDGLRHSGTMDRCGDENEVIVAAAVQASADFFGARSSDVQLAAFLAHWMTSAPGCTLENRYCDSPWLDYAREDQTKPYLGCSAVPGWLPAGLLLWLARRQRRLNRRGTGCAT